MYICGTLPYDQTAEGAQRSKEPALVDASGDALMAAMSAPTRSSDPINQLAEVVQNMQQQLQAFWPDAGDLDALGKTGSKGKKGGGAKGFGGKGKGEKGQNGAFNGSCWNCGVFGHRQSDCPGIGAGSGQQNQDKGGKNKGNKGDGKGFWSKGKGKGINEITWDSSYDGVASSSRGSTDPWGDYRVNSWNLAELATEQASGPASHPGVSPSPQPQQSGSPWAFGVKSLDVLSRNRVLCKNRFGTLAEEEDECDAEEEHATGLIDIPVIERSPPPPFLRAGNDGTQRCGCRLDQGCAKMPRKRRSKRNWSPIEATFGVKPAIQLRPLWKPGQGGALCPLQKSTECVFRGQRFKCVEAVVDSGAKETVVLRGIFPGPTRESAMSRAGASNPTLENKMSSLSPIRGTSVRCLSS